MVKRDDVISAIKLILSHQVLAKAKKMDTFANGIQVEGKSKVKKIATGVSVNLEFLEKAVEWGADMVIAHHGLNLTDRNIKGALLSRAAQKRLKFAFQNELTIAGYHASLDIHATVGNNAIIIQKLGAENLDIPFFDNWGMVAEYRDGIKVSELVEKCQTLFNHDVHFVDGGKDKINTIGVCSGGAKLSGAHLFEAYDIGIEAFISGEISEGLGQIAKESEISYLACGHYATETFGIQALGEKLSQHFGSKLELKFIDVPNVL